MAALRGPSRVGALHPRWKVSGQTAEEVVNENPLGDCLCKSEQDHIATLTAPLAAQQLEAGTGNLRPLNLFKICLKGSML